jgi:hypothetical protein
MMVPQNVDDAMLAAAHARMARKHASRRIAARAAAAAVILAAGLTVLLLMSRREVSAPAGASVASMDVNGDGRVDILDALALQQKIEGHKRLSPKWDINGDGRVDEEDVRAIAMFVVQPIALTLRPGGAARGAGAPGKAAQQWMMDVLVDSDGQRLAAYQMELTDPTGRSRIVGIEGGEHAAYREPPYYDPAAMAQEGRVILAAFSAQKELPQGKTRVARVFVEFAGAGEPQFQAKLIVAATSDGRKIPALVNIIASRKATNEPELPMGVPLNTREVAYLGP